MAWSFFVFVSTIAYALVCSRWCEELSDEFNLQKTLQVRQEKYIDCLRRWRRLEIQRTNNKQQVLLTKLRQLNSYLNDLKSIWQQKRGAFSVREYRKSEDDQRILNLALRSGADPQLVSRVLEEFDVVHQGTQNGDMTVKSSLSHDSYLRKEVDEIVIGQLRAHELCELHNITDAELQSEKRKRKAILLERVHQRGLVSSHSHSSTMSSGRHQELMPAAPDPIDHPVTASSQRLATIVSLGDSDGTQGPMDSGDSDDARHSSQQLPPFHFSVGAGSGAAKSDPNDSDSSFVTAQEQAMRECHDKHAHVDITDIGAMSTYTEAQDDEPSDSWWIVVEEFLQRQICKVIDDVLFYEPTHDTYWSHRHGNSLLLLCWKALCSLTHLWVIIAAIIQFAAYQSLAASVTVVLVLLALMAFPHPPATFWKSLQWYNLLVIFAKMVYQLPVFCGDGGCQASDYYAEGKKAPWLAVVGFRKIDPHTEDKDYGLAFESVFEAFFADLLVYMLLLLHWSCLSNSGRLADPVVVCDSLWRTEAIEIAEMKTPRNQPLADSELQTDPFGFGESWRQTGDDEVAAMQIPRHESLLAKGPPLSKLSQSSDLIPTETPVDKPHAAVALPSISSPRAPLVQGTSVNEPALPFQDGGDDEEDDIDMDASVTSESLTWQAWCAEICSSFHKIWIHGSKMRKPAIDFYILRTGILTVCFLIVLLGWHKLADTGWDINKSIAANTFRSTHVVTVVVFLFLIVLDRVLYTSYMLIGQHSQLSHENEAEHGSQSTMHPEPSKKTTWTEATSQAPEVDARLYSSLAQKFFLIVHLLTLHIVCIRQWAIREWSRGHTVSMFANPVFFIFYVLDMTYLALTALQQKYDVKVSQGGLGFTTSFTVFGFVCYRVYKFIPFVEELRVLADWTITETSLNFYMWMKLEDLQQSLYEVQMDMNWRNEYKRGEKRGKVEKFFLGGLLLVGLFALIVAPLLFFSTFNPFYDANSVISGVLEIELEVSADDRVSQIISLYRSRASGQGAIRNLGPSAASAWSRRHPEQLGPSTDLTVQSVSFPESSDTFWLITGERLLLVADIISKNRSTAWLKWSMTLDQNRTKGIPRPESFALNRQQISEFNYSIRRALSKVSADALEPMENEGANVQIEHAWHTVLQLSSSNLLKMGHEQAGPLNLTLETYSTNVSQANDDRNLWIWHAKVEECEQIGNVTDCGPSLAVISDKEGPLGDTTSSSTSLSVVGIYLGVVYTVGRFLRMAFSGSSKRIIYEELQDTALLRDLCNGIYISRIHGLLDSEYDLYYELIHIYRSPMLLLDVSKTTSHEEHSPIVARDRSNHQLGLPVLPTEQGQNAMPTSSPSRRSFRRRATGMMRRWWTIFGHPASPSRGRSETYAADTLDTPGENPSPSHASPNQSGRTLVTL